MSAPKVQQLFMYTDYFLHISSFFFFFQLFKFFDKTNICSAGKNIVFLLCLSAASERQRWSGDLQTDNQLWPEESENI